MARKIPATQPDMKLPLGITLTLSLLLLLQNFHQVSTQVPDSWKRNKRGNNENENGELSLYEVTSPGPEEKNNLGDEDTQVTPQRSESSSEDDGQAYGSYHYEQQDQNPLVTTQMPTAADVLPNNETEEEGSGSFTTTSPPAIALNSSSELSDSSAEHNETETQETAPNNVTSEPTPTPQTDLNGTYSDPKPENTTEDSNHEESGSGYLPLDLTTETPRTSTEAHEDLENMQNTTTVNPSETPAEETTATVTPPAIPEIKTTASPEIDDTEDNQNISSHKRGDLEKGFSSDDIQDKKKNQAWGVILVVGVTVGLIALIAFIVLNRRNKRDFSHRKLVEDISPDPVLRLDNSEPLDLKFDGFGYHNPGLQGDNIQMTNFPKGRSN